MISLWNTIQKVNQLYLHVDESQCEVKEARLKNILVCDSIHL